MAEQAQTPGNPATRGFDQHYWEEHWQQAHSGPSGHRQVADPNPYLTRETSSLTPGTALDAGCGEGGEAIWLASHGWHVTAADIASEALARAADREAANPLSQPVQWIRADLTVWEPGSQFDLVTTHYAHPSMPQLAFYDRICGWVAPGGTLLIVGHLQTSGSTGHGHHPPADASVTLTDITAGLDTTRWEIVTAEEHSRALTGPKGHSVPLHDIVARATRRL
jgi:SAM-dependent methyltransferase